MKKIGTGIGGIMVSMSNAEFSALAGKSPSNIPDGTDISLQRVQNMASFIEGKKTALKELYTQIEVVKETLEGLSNG